MSCTLTLCLVTAFELAHPPADAEAHRFAWEPLSEVTTADRDAVAVLENMNEVTAVGLINPVERMADPDVNTADMLGRVTGFYPHEPWVKDSSGFAGTGLGCSVVNFMVDVTQEASVCSTALQATPGGDNPEWWRNLVTPGPTLADIRQEPRDSAVFLVTWPTEMP